MVPPDDKSLFSDVVLTPTVVKALFLGAGFNMVVFSIVVIVPVLDVDVVVPPPVGVDPPFDELVVDVLSLEVGVVVAAKIT